MLNWLRKIFTIRGDRTKFNKVMPETKAFEQELKEVDRILRMTDPEEKKKYYPKMKELLSKISSYYEKQSGLDFNAKEFEDFSKYIDLMRELTKASEITS